MENGRYTLHHGDCLDILPTLEARSVDAVITDPPYGTTACSWDSVIPFEPMWAAIRHVLKPCGAVVLFGSQPFTSALVMSNPKWFRYAWYWQKESGTGFLNASIQPLKIIEDIAVFGGGSTVYNPQMKPCKTYKASYSKKNLSSDVYGDAIEIAPILKVYTEKHPSTLLAFKRDDGKLHPTQKPVALLEYLIRTYTNEGDTVLDFTFGSCSTGIACLNTGRKFIGIEKDEAYFGIGGNRMKEREDYLTQIGSIPLSYDKIDKGKLGYQARSLFEYQQIVETE